MEFRKDGNDNPICKTEKETQMYRTDFWTLWEKARVGCFKRIAWKHVYYLGWNRSPAQVGCMRQVLGPGALGRARGIGSRGRWEGGSGWGIHVNPWLIHVNVWQKPLQYCKVISLQLIKINGKKKPPENVTIVWVVDDIREFLILSDKGIVGGSMTKTCFLNFKISYSVNKATLWEINPCLCLKGL